jgi:drug/metabolite transporter (DMT)-like permease
MSASRLEWLLFILLGFIWGSSYLFIKIGVDAGLPPFTLVMLRLAIGSALLATVVFAAREPLPRDLRTYGHLAVLGVISIALPFSLITWAEQRVDSTLASILASAIPLFVIVIAAFALHDERITVNRVAGLVVGFGGVAILVGLDPAALADGDLVAKLALVGAAISYASGGVYARRFLHGLRPMIPAFLQDGFALVMVAVLAFSFEDPLGTAFSAEALVAIVWLGLLGSGVAYLLFFRILDSWGATRTSLVAYLMPVFGIALGAAVLSEPVDASLLAGAALVIGGIALVNAPPGWIARLARQRPAVDEPLRT